ARIAAAIDLFDQLRSRLSSGFSIARIDSDDLRVQEFYQRRVPMFSSHLQLVVKPVAGADTTWLKPGQSIVLDESVSHGPFPLAQL
ncbi:DUF945 family protein, partial [Salmonella enterica subsp. enterica serovar Kentucky]|nr:DUF945 family protein [Salmonella enterica subsp. enterica serovar Kentucky]